MQSNFNSQYYYSVEESNDPKYVIFIAPTFWGEKVPCSPREIRNIPGIFLQHEIYNVS